ncbi:adenosine deaminase family protein [Kineococcus sp. SYSU DK003]|uniref:adenosine deaminase family protein n=1 Tax=Kineococcus sp. SYSU DK003 TaxID=3383124 RepID=UPI003D7EB59C
MILAAASTSRYLAAVPTTELHCHFASTIRPGRLVGWARERGVALRTDDPAELARYTGLQDFLELFNAAHAVFRSADDIALVAYEGVRACVATANLRYREYYVNPDNFADLGLGWPTVLSGMVAGLTRAREEFGVGFGIVPAVDRSRDLATAHAMLDTVLASPHPAVVGLGQDDLAADGYESATAWEPVFRRAREAGLRTSAHVGEISTSTAASVVEAVEVLGLDRVDHGYHVLDDPAVVEAARASGVHFNCTPTSAHLLSGWALDTTHPVARMIEAGLPVNLSTDDEVFFDTSLSAEFEHLTTDFGFGPDVVEAVCLNGVEASFTDEGTKETLRREFRVALDGARALLDA